MEQVDDLPPPLPPPIPRKLDPAATTRELSTLPSPVPFYALAFFASVMAASLAAAAAWGIILFVGAITGWNSVASYLATTVPLVGLMALTMSFGAAMPMESRKFLKNIAVFLVLMPALMLILLLIGNGSINAAWVMWIVMNAATVCIAAIAWGSYVGMAVLHFGRSLRNAADSNP